MRAEVLRCLSLLGSGLVFAAATHAGGGRVLVPTTDVGPELVSSAIELSKQGKEHPCVLLRPWRRHTVISGKPHVAMRVWRAHGDPAAAYRRQRMGVPAARTSHPQQWVSGPLRRGDGRYCLAKTGWTGVI